MPENIKVGLVGGDRRQTVVAERVGKKYECAAWGIDDVPECAVRCADWRSAVKGAEAVILPLPASRDGVYLNTDDGIKLDDICSAIGPGTLLCGGMIPSVVKAHAEERGAEVFDYYDSESVQIRNAVPTAEGTIAALIGEMPMTVSGMTVLITGYGRCARTLAQRLILLGASVYVAARSERDLAWASVDGCSVVTLEEFCDLPPECDAVVNTIPVRVIDERILSMLNPRTVIFDLSNGAAGVDGKAAEKYGMKVVILPSLPGKTSPRTSGDIIADAISRKLEERFESGGCAR